MKKIAVIVAGGTGTRMNNTVPKQFLLLKNKPVLFYTINTFLNSFNDLEIILVLPLHHIETGKQIISTYFSDDRITITAGGETRFHSVKNGLQLINEESIVFVHDAVRCLLTSDLIKKCYHTALEYGSAVPVIDCKDSVRIVTGHQNISVERASVKLVQTPQTFKSEILLPAFTVNYNNNFTDEATVVELSGVAVNLVEGEESNIKITRPIDLIIAESLVTP